VPVVPVGRRRTGGERWTRASSSTGQRRSAGPRLGAGSQARRAKREADPPRTYKNPSPLPCAGSVGARRMPRRGRGCGGLGDADDPACPGPRRRGRPRSGRPQAPLELHVEEVFTAASRLASGTAKVDRGHQLVIPAWLASRSRSGLSWLLGEAGSTCRRVSSASRGDGVTSAERILSRKCLRAGATLRCLVMWPRWVPG
jgi:hypothetical protein